MNLLNLKLLFSTTFRQISSHSLSSEAGWIKTLVNPDWQSPLKQTNVTAAVTRDTGNLTHSTKVVSLFFMDLNFIALQTSDRPNQEFTESYRSE